VTEVLRGDPGLKQCTVLCRHFDVNAAQQALMMEARAKKAGFNWNQEEMIKRAALIAEESYLLVLMPDEVAVAAAGEKPPMFSTGFVPVHAGAAELIADVRKLAQRIPELTPEQRSAAAKHLAELGASGYEARAKASQALLALGPAVRKLVEESSKSSGDLEIQDRCNQIVDDLKPIPGGKPEDWAGKASVRKPADKPDEKPPPKDDPTLK
jgi:hypothetical protein